MLPFYIFVIYRIAFAICNKYYPTGYHRHQYFIYGLGAEDSRGFLYRSYLSILFSSGDTAYYFYHSKVINSTFSESIVKWFSRFFHIPSTFGGEYLNHTSKMEWYNDMRPTYNRPVLLNRAIRCVLRQWESNISIEVIVIDDCSLKKTRL
ncbi:MAG: hypothetical protein QM530_09655 [Phycisphaerales bacterium]|nr:hypothetical protein [Phycisphaerales bacterium]